MAKLFSNPVFVATVTGLLSSIGLIYYVSKAASPGIIDMLAIAIIAILFGIFVGLSSAALSMVVNFKKFFSNSACVNCSNEIPGNANFCPHCGKRSVYFTWEINNFHARKPEGFR